MAYWRAVLLAAGAALAFQAGAEDLAPGLPVGDMVPAFHLVDVAGPDAGARFSLM